MPALIRNPSGWTLKKLIQNTYRHMENRFDYKDRDVLKGIRIKKVYQYNLSKNVKRTTYIIESYSYPQYYPYYTKKDSRGRERTYQRTYKHQYDVTISLDRLSINAPVKLRLGSNAMWDFTPRGRSKKINGRVQEGTNVKRGINGDFFFRCSYLYKQHGILYGENKANGAPVKANPKMIVFLPKHILNVVEVLMNRGILKDD